MTLSLSLRNDTSSRLINTDKIVPLKAEAIAPGSAGIYPATDVAATPMASAPVPNVGTECTLVHCSLYTRCIYRVLTPRELKNQVVNLQNIATPNIPNCGAFGDFGDSDDECEVETDAEPRIRYWEGLYCPLHVGEVLDGRYRIEHKLGWGGFSTVWLAHDTQQNKAVALR
jgi:hypothetical protein